MPIEILPQTLINQIAAGEVVVRMASVAKELVENSIDADSSRIEVSVTNEARNLEIRDNGIGMDREDAELCLQRHATSKIRTQQDLVSLATRGFRGEALPSIASVSRLEIQTRPRDHLSGSRILVEGGHIEKIEKFGCPPGTRIQVRDLFYNTPARLKFLKSKVSEMNAIMSTITRQALAQPDIAFSVRRDTKELLDLPEGQDLTARFRSLLGAQIKRETILVDFARDDIHVTGIMAHPLDARGDRRGQYLFVNERPFSSKQIIGALEQACRGFVMTSRFPVFALFIQIPPGEVDFNVHPTKEEVRFQDERRVSGTVYRAVEAAFQGSRTLVGEVQLEDRIDPSRAEEQDKGTPGKEAGTSASSGTGESNSRPPSFFTSPDQLVRRAFDRKQSHVKNQSDWLVERERNEPVVSYPTEEKAAKRIPNVYRKRGSGSELIAAGPGEYPDPGFWRQGIEPVALGQVSETYIMARYGDDLLIIDQHASHERLVYLELKKQNRQIDQQPLLVPITIELSPAQSEIVSGFQERLQELGFDLSEFGPRTWAVNAVPTDLPEFDPVPLILELVEDLEDEKKINALDDLRDRIMIRTACHSAIRAGEILSLEKQQELLNQIKREKLSLTCPHGRPTIVRLGKQELDKQFKRIV